MQHMNFSYDFPNCSVGTKDKRSQTGYESSCSLAAMWYYAVSVGMEVQMVQWEEDRRQIYVASAPIKKDKLAIISDLLYFANLPILYVNTQKRL